jgi:hypothetical protein
LCVELERRLVRRGALSVSRKVAQHVATQRVRAGVATIACDRRIDGLHRTAPHRTIRAAALRCVSSSVHVWFSVAIVRPRR